MENRGTIKVKRHEASAGFSLIELLFAVLILLMILGTLSTILAGVRREFNAQKPRMEALNNAQAAVDTISRLSRMAGTKPFQCPTAFVVPGLVPSNLNADGSYARLRIRSDWNPADCSLTGVTEDVTISVLNGNLYMDAAQTEVFVERIAAVRFRFYDSSNAIISDPVTNANLIKIVRIEIDPLVPGEPVRTIWTSVQVRSR